VNQVRIALVNHVDASVEFAIEMDGKLGIEELARQAEVVEGFQTSDLAWVNRGNGGGFVDP
jgi:hypothetical protein